MIPKNDQGDVRGIGLLKTIHKVVSSIINMRMNDSVRFCKEVHGFRRKMFHVFRVITYIARQSEKLKKLEI